jgi:adenylate cyclase
VRDPGKMALRSVAQEVPLYEIELAPSPDPAWIDPVCKMHAPYASYRRAAPEGPWFCSPRCEEAYRKSPQTYPLARCRQHFVATVTAAPPCASHP